VGRYSKAPEVQEIAEKLIEEHHPHLRNETIRYIWRDKHTMSKGKLQLIKPQKVAGLAGWLHLGYYADGDPDRFSDLFVLEVARDTWDRLDAEQRVALIDHGLCHFDVEIPDQGDKDRRLLVRAPDVSEFQAIVERHGPWRPALEDLLKAANQLTIDDQRSRTEPVEDRGGEPSQEVAEDPPEEEPRLKAVKS
jgi:hypothetical protein